jgi:hypothetical protein
MAESLYDRDLQDWIAQTIQHLQNREFDRLDIEHLIEELVDLGKSEKNALKSNLTILLAHLLKLRVQADVPDTMKASWYSSVIEHRQRVFNNLADNSAFKNYLPEILDAAYIDARKLAIKQGKLAKFGVAVTEEQDYPTTCPFAIAQILDEDFLGDSGD